MTDRAASPASPSTAIVTNRTPVEQAEEYATVFAKGLLGALPGVGTLLNEAFFESRNREGFRRFVRHVESTHALVLREVGTLREQIEDFDRKLEERKADAEAAGVMWNYVEQATHEPMVERQVMLAHAHASITDVRLSVAEHARFQRRLGEIEPADVIALYAISRTYGRAYDGKMIMSESELKYHFWESFPGAEALEASGCVRIIAEGGGAGVGTTNGLRISDFGRLVLRILRTYVRPRSASIAIPGRELIPGGRSTAEAHEFIDGYPELRSIIGAHVRQAPSNLAAARYMAPSWSQGSTGKLDLPHPHGAARVDLYGVDASTAKTLEAMAPVDVALGVPMSGKPCEKLVIQTAPVRDRDVWTVMITGPHDVLRRLVEELEIEWL
jgi:hypothetical protein